MCQLNSVLFLTWSFSFPVAAFLPPQLPFRQRQVDTNRTSSMECSTIALHPPGTSSLLGASSSLLSHSFHPSAVAAYLR